MPSVQVWFWMGGERKFVFKVAKFMYFPFAYAFVLSGKWSHNRKDCFSSPEIHIRSWRSRSSNGWTSRWANVRSTTNRIVKLSSTSSNRCVEKMFSFCKRVRKTSTTTSWSCWSWSMRRKHRQRELSPSWCHTFHIASSVKCDSGIQLWRNCLRIWFVKWEWE